MTDCQTSRTSFEGLLWSTAIITESSKQATLMISQTKVKLPLQDCVPLPTSQLLFTSISFLDSYSIHMYWRLRRKKALSVFLLIVGCWHDYSDWFSARSAKPMKKWRTHTSKFIETHITESNSMKSSHPGQSVRMLQKQVDKQCNCATRAKE